MRKLNKINEKQFLSNQSINNESINTIDYDYMSPKSVFKNKGNQHAIFGSNLSVDDVRSRVTQSLIDNASHLPDIRRQNQRSLYNQFGPSEAYKRYRSTKKQKLADTSRIGTLSKNRMSQQPSSNMILYNNSMLKRSQGLMKNSSIEQIALNKDKLDQIMNHKISKVKNSNINSKLLLFLVLS